MQQTNKDVVIALLSETDKGNMDIVCQYYSENYIEHNSHSAKHPAEETEGIKKIFQVFRNAFPDAVHVVEDIIAEEDKVAARITFRGTFVNPLFNYAPSGKPVESTGTAIYRIQNGKIVEKWGGISAWDVLETHLKKCEKK